MGSSTISKIYKEIYRERIILDSFYLYHTGEPGLLLFARMCLCVGVGWGLSFVTLK